jgi:hypothetical protein
MERYGYELAAYGFGRLWEYKIMRGLYLLHIMEYMTIPVICNNDSSGRKLTKLPDFFTSEGTDVSMMLTK